MVVREITCCVQVVRINTKLQVSALSGTQLPNTIPVKPSKSVLVLWGQSFVEFKQAMFCFCGVPVISKAHCALLLRRRSTFRKIFGSCPFNLDYIFYLVWLLHFISELLLDTFFSMLNSQGKKSCQKRKIHFKRTFKVLCNQGVRSICGSLSEHEALVFITKR